MIVSYGFPQYLHVFFQVRRIICDITIELSCLRDLKNLGQLPVSEVKRLVDITWL